jgi:UDP-N-acetylmuramyl pentapeptide phosphotransferase/UDP-N-acetylglucosamine-1-phosphate transferase
VIIGVVMAAAMIAFAPFNVPRAHVFLGDSGSYGLGAALAGMTIVAFNLGLPIEAALGPLALYLADTGTTIVRRVAAGQAWHQPHRSHVYQRLTAFGFSHGQVSAFVGGLVAVTSGLGALSLTGDVLSRVAADVALFALLAAYLVSPHFLGHRRVEIR